LSVKGERGFGKEGREQGGGYRVQGVEKAFVQGN
jgi:hypothetical protein